MNEAARDRADEERGRPLEGSEADRLEQSRSWDEDDDVELPKTIPPDVPEADALEQSRSVPLDEDREP